MPKSSNARDNNSMKINNIYIEQDRLTTAVDKTRAMQVTKKGIGTLAEKTMHSVLKLYYEPDEDKHEVALEGYFADIYNEQGIIEVQTRQLNKLRDKLAVFLNLYPVTVVYPCPYNKWLRWVDPDTGEISDERRLSPRHYSEYDAFYELYKIKMFLKNPNLRIHLVLMDVEEYRYLNGWNDTKKKGSTRCDRIPLGIDRIVKIEEPEDYMMFLPIELPDTFTVKDYAECCHISRDAAGTVLNILYYMGTVRRVGKNGNAYLYEVAGQ